MRTLHRRATWLVCLLGLAVTSLVTVRVLHGADTDHHERVMRAANRLHADLGAQIERLQAGLITMRDSQVSQAAALAQGVDRAPDAPRWRVSPEGFQALAEIATAPEGALHHARAVGLVRVVDPGELAIYEQRILGRIAPGLAVTPPPTSHAYVVQQLAPLQGNEAAEGLDLGRQADRRAAIEGARDTGAPAVTAPLDLGDGHPTSVLLFVPAFDAAMIPETVAERRARFVGGLAAMVEPHALLDAAPKDTWPLQVALIDVGVWHDPGREGIDVADPVVLAGDPPAHADVVLDVHVADRHWHLVAAPAAGFPPADRWPALTAFLVGLLLTVTLGALVHLLVTRREHAERRVDEATRSLRAREEELQQANERLQASDEIKTRFLVTVSHELRTPLTTVRGFANLLEHRHDELTDAERTAFISQLARGAEGLSDLLHEVLDFATEQANGLDVQPGPFDVEDAIQRCLREQPRSHEVVVDGHAPGPAHGDRQGFMRVLNNLLVNARSYSEPGSRIGIWIRAAHDAHGEAIEIVVSDEGPGIPEEERELVFERFHRGHLAASGTVSGTGIGLTVARQLMEAMGGHICVEDSIAGARLLIRLPLSREAVPARRTKVRT